MTTTTTTTTTTTSPTPMATPIDIPGVASRSKIDRALHRTLPNSTISTPSQTNNDDVTPLIELTHRLHGTSLIAEACHMLYRHMKSNDNAAGISVYSTACVLLHRFYHRVSLCQFDVWSVAMGCVVLAGKIEEFPIRLRRVVLVFAHLYRRRRLEVGYQVGENDESRSDDNNVSESGQRVLTDTEKRNVMRFQKPMSPLSQEYRVWEDAIIKSEVEILRQLGFMLSWISDSHPHKFILYIVRAVCDDIPNNEVAQLAWNYCNDSYRLDLCVHYEAEIIACSAIFLAANDRQVSLPMWPRPWWASFVGDHCERDIAQVSNAILALYDSSLTSKPHRCFIPSLLSGSGSFNDPESMIWNENN